MTALSPLRWVAAHAMGEAMGIAAVSIAYAALDRGLLATAPAWILAAGAWEGLCLGTAQAVFLRRLGVAPARWVVLTVFAAIAGYAISLAGGAGEGAGPEPAHWLMVILGAGAGLGMGVVMGLLQSTGLSAALSPRRWIIANAIGWMPAMAVIMLGAGLAERSWPLAGVALLGAASGAVAGVFVGLATLRALR